MKFGYISPKADVLLLQNEDVISTSALKGVSDTPGVGDTIDCSLWK